MSIRILIADDHGVIRAGLRSLLETNPDFQVIGEASDGYEAVNMTFALQPDILLLDLSLPGLTGLEVAKMVLKSYPSLKILFLTVSEDESLAREAICAGACGYIIKRAVEGELLSAIHAVWRGELYIYPSLTRALLNPKLVTPSLAEKRKPAVTLTRRELDVLRLIAKGHTNRQIAELLNLSTRTVEGHRANLMGKLNLHSRVDLVNCAESMGLLGSLENSAH
jgi:two-component system, NarL family, response regulator NreC